MTINAFFKLYFLILLFPCQLSAQWSKTVHQTVGLPDTLTRFYIKSNFPIDTLFWIGSDILIETTVSMAGVKESIFEYLMQSDRYKWILALDDWRFLKPLQSPLIKFDGMTEQVKLKIYIPEYFRPSANNFFILAGLKE